jgi:hypothetical protein
MRVDLIRSVSAFALMAALAGGSALAQTGGSGAPGQSGSGATQQQQLPQQGGSEMKGGGDRGSSGQRSGAGTQSGAGGGTETPKASDRAREKASPKSAVQGNQDTPKASERAQEKASPKSAVRQGDKDANGKQRAEDKRGREGKQRAEDKAGQKSGTFGQGPEGRKGTGAGGGRAGEERKAGEERMQDRTQSRAGEEDKGARVQLSEQQRTTIRERITTHRGGRDRVTNVNFDIRVGARVPRTLTLYELPPDVISIVPEYRGYRYVVVEDEIVIVNPRTYAIVAVVDSGGRAASRGSSGSVQARLTLTPEQKRFLVTHIERRPAVSLGIGNVTIGMRVPGTVELRPMPEVVVERIPDLRQYRYFVFEDEVAIVDPRSSEVVLTVEE